MIHAFLICMALAAVVAAFLVIACLIVGTHEDADLAAPTPGMGEPGGPFLFDAPEFRDQVRDYAEAMIAAIDAEFARRAGTEAAELDDDAAVAAWLGGGA